MKATRLDFSLVKPYVKVIGFTMLLPIAFAAINRSILTGVSFAMCFIAMTTGYTFSVTEKNSMERLYPCEMALSLESKDTWLLSFMSLTEEQSA